MTPKEAVAAARKYLEETFAGELAAPSRLEEIWFVESLGEWRVTFNIWRTPVQAAPLPNPPAEAWLELKVVGIKDSDGTPVSIMNRAYTAA